MQPVIGHCVIHPHLMQLWSSQSGIVLYPTLQHHAASGGPQQCADSASPSPIASPKPAYLPSSKVVSTAREVLARCLPGQVLQCLRPFADRLHMQGWTLLISDCGKSGEHHKALAVFQAVPQKNVWHHSALIAALGACGQCEQALQHLEQLKQLALQDSTLQPNHITYSAAIAACARVQRLDYVMQLFTEMQAKGLEPDSVTYYIVQSTAVRVGEWQLVESMLQTMHSKGIPARTVVYAAYIRQLCRNQQWNQALGIFLIMQDLGVPATSAMIAELLRTFNHCHKHQMAVVLLKEAEAAGLVNSVGMYDSTLRALLETGQAQTAAELCDFMQQTGRWQPTSSFLDQLQNGSTAVDQAAAAVAAMHLQRDSTNGHATAAVVSGQAVEARANCIPSRSSSDGQISPQSSGDGELGEAVTECLLDQCEAACYLPAAACSCASDTGTVDSITTSTELSSIAAGSSVAASVVRSPLARRDGCSKTCSASSSTDSLNASTASTQQVLAIAMPGSTCSDTALVGMASVDTAGQQRSQLDISGRTSNRQGSRPSCDRQTFQYYSNGHRVQYGTYHGHQHSHHRQQHRIMPCVPYNHNHHHHQQQQHLPGRGQRGRYNGADCGSYINKEHIGQRRSNHQQQQRAAPPPPPPQQQQQQSQLAACGNCEMAAHAEAAV